MQESLNGKTEELKALYLEKKQLETSLREAEYGKRKMEAELKAKKAKLSKG